VRSQAQLRCAVAATALERYRLAHGRWPDSLAALVPEFLREVPTDPYDGAPLRFRRLVDQVIVYSVGADGEDDGGNVTWLHPNTPGTDLGFRLWNVDRRRQPPPREHGKR
jgi:type II secretory pathway pseudopilin PulG